MCIRSHPVKLATRTTDTFGGGKKKWYSLTGGGSSTFFSCRRGSIVFSFQVKGYRVLMQAGPGPPRRPRCTLPGMSCFVYLAVGDKIVRYRWVPWIGLQLHSETSDIMGATNFIVHRQYVGALSMKKREALGLSGVPLPAAPKGSKFLSKTPTIDEYLTQTAYEDGTPRMVSALRTTTRGGMWSLTITDPDARARLVMVAADCDKAMLALEALLQAPDCPWEPDPWAPEPKAPRGKKK